MTGSDGITSLQSRNIAVNVQAAASSRNAGRSANLQRRLARAATSLVTSGGDFEEIFAIAFQVEFRSGSKSFRKGRQTEQRAQIIVFFFFKYQF